MLLCMVTCMKTIYVVANLWEFNHSHGKIEVFDFCWHRNILCNRMKIGQQYISVVNSGFEFILFLGEGACKEGYTIQTIFVISRKCTFVVITLREINIGRKTGLISLENFLKGKSFLDYTVTLIVVPYAAAIRPIFLFTCILIPDLTLQGL